MDKHSDGQAKDQGIFPSSSAVIHLTSPLDIPACVLHLANVSSLDLFVTPALGMMRLSTHVACYHIGIVPKDAPRPASQWWCKLQAQDLTLKAVCVSVHIWGFGSWYLARWVSRLLSAKGRGCGTAPVHGKQVDWEAQFNASHNQDHSSKCCARAGFLVMVHKWWCATSVPGWALLPCGMKEGMQGLWIWWRD